MTTLKIRNETNTGWIEFPKFDPTLTLTAGSYLSGGGDLSANRIFNFEPSLVSHTLLADIGTNTHADIDNHIAATNNPHSVTAAQIGALVSVDGVSNAGGGIDLVASDAISITPDDTENKITIGESHSSLTNNPHSVTAAQVGALVSVDGVSNAGGDIDFVASNAITITPDDANNKITIGESHSSLTNNPHNVTAAQVGKDTAQWNADKLQGWAISAATPTDGYALKWNDGASQWEPGPVVTQLSGLSDVGSVSYTAGYVLRADGTNFDAAQLQHGDLGGVGASDHHAYPIPTAGLADDAVTVDKLAHNIDATGIGFNAAKLGGLTSGQFLRSDADDTIATGVTISGTANNSGGPVLSLNTTTNEMQPAILVTVPDHTANDTDVHKGIHIDHQWSTYQDVYSAGLFVTTKAQTDYGAGIWVRNKGKGDSIYCDVGSQSAAGENPGGLGIDVFKNGWGVLIKQCDSTVGVGIKIYTGSTDIGSSGAQLVLCPHGPNHEALVIQPYDDTDPDAYAIHIKEASGATKFLVHNDGGVFIHDDDLDVLDASDNVMVRLDDAGQVKIRGDRIIEFDSGDYIVYDASSNYYKFYIGGALRMYLTDTGNLYIDGSYLTF